MLERHPAVHLLVNNAGVPARGTFLRVEPAVIRRAIEVNYLGGVWCTRAFLPGLEAAPLATDGGHRQPRLHRRHRGVRACRRVRGLEACAARVLAVPLAALLGSAIRVHTVLPGFAETEGSRRRTSCAAASCAGS